MNEIRKLASKISNLAKSNSIDDVEMSKVLNTSKENVYKLYIGEYILSSEQANRLANYLGIKIKDLLNTESITEENYCRYFIGKDNIKSDHLDEILDIISEYTYIKNALGYFK